MTNDFQAPNSLLFPLFFCMPPLLPYCQVSGPSLKTKFRKNALGKLVTPSLGLVQSSDLEESFCMRLSTKLLSLYAAESSGQGAAFLTLNA